MGLGLLLLSSVGAGYLLNSKKNARPPKYTHEPIKPKETVGSNIYHSRDFYKNKKDEARRVIKNWEDAKFPLSTNIIPMFYNTLDIKQDAEKVPNANYDKKMIYSVLDGLDGRTKQIIKNKLESPEYILKHIPDNARAGDTDWGLVSGRPSSDRLENKNGALEQVGGSLLPNRGYEDFTHNNMVPFYSGALKQNMDSDNRMGAGKLEIYTGQFKNNHEQKEEQGPMFAPTAGLTNIHGSYEQRDMSRYIPSNTGKKNNEAPFEQIQVGPGLNDGYTARPSGGFHQSLRIRPKPIENLRVDPVIEQEGRINAGKSHVDKRTLVAQQYKNRPELLVENKNGERNFTTVGAIHGRKLRPTVLLRDTHRKKSKQLITAAKSTEVTAPQSIPKAKISTRKNFNNTSFRNATQARTKRHNDYGKSGYKNRLNARAFTGTKNHTLNIKPAEFKQVNHLQDKAKKTRKEHYSAAHRLYGYANPQTSKGLPAYDPLQVARATIRETTENNNGQTGFISRIGAGGQVAYDPTQVAKTTIRETTENKKHQGWLSKLGAGAIQKYNLDPANPTIRETTEGNLHIGFNNPCSVKKHIAYDPLQVAKTTIRETTENKKHLAGVSGAPQKKHIAYDPDAKAKTTIRETTESCGRKQGNVVSIQKKHIAYDPNDVAKTTIRETTEDGKRVGNVQRGALQHGKGYLATKWEANNTNRQFTSDYEYTGIANSNTKKTSSYEAAYNAEQDTNKEEVAKGRKPMGDSVKLGPHRTDIEMKKLDDDRTNQRGHVKDSTSGNIFNPGSIKFCTNTSDKNNLPSHDFRLDSSLVEAYRKNPLTQSLASYA